MARQIIAYVAVIALLLSILGVSGAALYFTVVGSGVEHPTLSVVTYTPSGKITKVAAQKTTPSVIPVPNTPTVKIQFKTADSNLNPTLAPSSTPSCGLSAPMKLLYINLGKDGESSPSQAVRLIGINPSDKTLNIISYPCDLWVTTPSLVSDYTISAIRLCSLIQLVKDTAGKNANNSDIAKAIQTALNDTFKVKSDQYLITTTDSLVTSVDQLSGIEFTSAKSITISGVNIQKGINQVNSTAISSLFSGSSQDDTSAWDLVDRQNNILSGIENKFITLSSVTLAGLIKKSNSDTSLSAQDINALECTLKVISPGQIQFSEIIKSNTGIADDGSITITNLPDILAEMNKIFKQVPPDTATPLASPTPRTTAVIAPQASQPAVEATPASSPTPLLAPLPPITTRLPPPTTGTQLPAPPPAPTSPSTSLDGKSLVDERCTQCHGLSIVQRKHTAAEWQAILADMVNRGTQLNAVEQAAVLTYLSTTYGR